MYGEALYGALNRRQQRPDSRAPLQPRRVSFYLASECVCVCVCVCVCARARARVLYVCLCRQRPDGCAPLQLPLQLRRVSVSQWLTALLRGVVTHAGAWRRR
jgi:hypothetical protein